MKNAYIETYKGELIPCKVIRIYKVKCRYLNSVEEEEVLDTEYPNREIQVEVTIDKSHRFGSDNILTYDAKSIIPRNKITNIGSGIFNTYIMPYTIGDLR